MLIDNFQRRIEYLRLSVTGLCNIRCHYCLPPEGISEIHQTDVLNFDEVERMVRLLAGLGIRRVRLTGGEPLVRKGVPELVRRLHEIKGLDGVLLTTNGILLAPLANDLRKAGLSEINIHLDTLDPERFRRITRLGDIREVFEGMDAAKKAGFSPIKLNAVLQRGINDDEIEDLLHFAEKDGFILRLIELMPIGPGRDLMPSTYISSGEIRKRLEEKFTLIPSLEKPGGGPAVYYRIRETGTLVGFISAVSQPFCADCNRIRISSDGRFQDCLAYDGNFSLKDLLRNHRLSDEDIAMKVQDLMAGKREGHEGFVQLPALRTPCMSAIGG